MMENEQKENEFIVEDKIGLYNTDCVELAKEMPDNSIDFSIYSPPFADMFVYSDNIRDMGNCKSYDDFFIQYEFLIKEMYRVIRPGRLVAIHCIDMPLFKGKDGRSGLRDFQGDIIRAHEKHGFTFHSRVTIWKDPVIEVTRTKAHGLLYATTLKDSANSRQGVADYLVVMGKKAENSDKDYVPIHHPKDTFYDYAGSSKIPEPYDYKDQKQYERLSSINIWQRYASPVWFDIRQTCTLNTKVAKSDKDGKHICPLQLDVITRSLQLWTNEHDTVFSPFNGIGSEGYCSIKMNRKYIGAELKKEYFDVSIDNLKSAMSDNINLFTMREDDE